MTSEIRFALYARVSTEDQQDPESSLAWQRRRADTLIAGHGEITVVYFDQGISRSVMWKQRPEANRLLMDLRDPDRGWDACVVGEPQRAFHGNQFGLVFPLFVNRRVNLWVPEVGGPIDPESEAHDMMMTMFASMGKAERKRIQVRVRTSMEALTATEGRYLGGRPPYGYELVDLHPHPKDPARQLRGLAPDPATAPIVAKMFDWYVGDRWSFGQIARKLNDESVPCPSAHDPGRNPHRTGRRWTSSTVAAILANPRYTGHQFWQRTKGLEQMVDEDDVEAGYRKVYADVDRAEWVKSPRKAHTALITEEVWAMAQSELELGRARRGAERASVAKRTYPLTSLVSCACGRRMEADSYRGHARYRCPGQKLDPDHPRRAWVREDRILTPLDEWIGRLFEPEYVDNSLAAILDAPDDPFTEARRIDAEKRIATCDRKLSQYRKALDEGADPAVIGGWIADVRNDRTRAEGMLADCTSDQPTEAEISAMTTWFAECADRFTGMMTRIDPERRKAFYQALGLRLIVTAGSDQVAVSLRPQPRGKDGVGGGT